MLSHTYETAFFYSDTYWEKGNYLRNLYGHLLMIILPLLIKIFIVFVSPVSTYNYLIHFG